MVRTILDQAGCKRLDLVGQRRPEVREDCGLNDRSAAQKKYPVSRSSRR